MVCRKCTAHLPEEAKFCAKCGSVQMTQAMRMSHTKRPEMRKKGIVSQGTCYFAEIPVVQSYAVLYNRFEKQ